MTGWLASAIAAPVLVDETPADRLARCVAAAEAEAADVGFAPGTADRSDRVAVVVGVPCHESEAIPSLAYGTRDAARIGARLASAGFTVVPLLSQVSRAELEAALDRAEQLLEPGGTLVVYFSGHGVLREEDGRIRRYLVLTDTDLAELPTTSMAVPALEARIARIGAARRVVVQDTCFAARPGGKSVADVGHGKGIALPEPGGRLAPGDVQLYASRFYEQAIESPERRGSVYTWHLLDGLDRADADLDGDGCVGLVEAHEWASRRTDEERQGFQVPQLRGESPENVRLACEPHAASRAVLGAPTGDHWLVEVSQADEVVGTGTGALEPGRYHVRVERLEETATDVVTRTVMSGPLGVRAGEWVDLREELDRRRPYGIVEAIGAARATDVVPDLAPGIGAWWAARDRGAGRPALGAVLRAASDPEFRDVEAHGRVGWWFTFRRPRIDVGPVVAYGGYLRTARDEDGGPLSREVGPMYGGALRTQLARGPVVLGLEAGAQVLPVFRDLPDPPEELVLEVNVAPTVGIAVGVRL